MTNPTSTALPYDWLKSLEPRLVDRGRTAIVETPEEFSWEALSHALAEHFEIPDFEIHASATKWVEGKALHDLQAPTTSLRYAVGEFPGEAYWLMPTDAITQLMSDVLTGQSGLLPTEDTAFLNGFLNYVAAETLQLLGPLGFRQSLTPRFLGNEAPKDLAKALSIDLQIHIFQRSYPAHLLISEDLATAWKEHFMRLGRRQELSAALANQTEIIAHLESGRVTLSQEQWFSVSKGDFILLDTSTIVPGVEKGRVMLTVGGIPLFRCMLKTGQIKLLEHPLYHEVETAMNENHEDEESFDEEEHDDHDEEEHDDLDEEEHDEHDEEENEEHDEEHDEEENDEDIDLESHEDHEDEETEEEYSEEEEDHPHEAEKLTPAQKIPLTIVVEVGRLKMSLSKLRDLQPGQMLEIDVKPEEGVNLVINGACVGRGELLRVGETLGVRILELG